ncbi:MAG TPA: outer membrane protein transport protein [Calditrichia bacterium]|nr:outer membrane protein transport protein [Calditrichia bacterium]
MRRAMLLAAIMMLSGMTFAQSAFDAIRIMQGEIGVGARALGMGGAYTGLADDYTALYWNPAGLAALGKSEFFGEVSHLNFNNSAAFRNTLTEDAQNYTRLRALGFALPLPTRQGSLVLAFGYNRVKDFDENLLFAGFNPESNGLSFEIDGNDFPFDQNVYQTQNVVDEGGMDQFNLGFGIALSPNFNAGVTATIWSGEDDYQYTFRQEDRENNYTAPGDYDYYILNRNLLTDYGGFALKIGGMFDLGNGLQLGGTIGLPHTINVEENYTENDLVVFDDGFESPYEWDPQTYEYDVELPFYFDGGVSFANDNLTVAGSFRYRDWSQVRFDISNDLLGQSGANDLLDENLFLRNDYRATLEYRLGGELSLDGMNGSLRGGYAYLPSPIKNASSDMDRRYITAGMGFKLDRFVVLDLTYMRGSWIKESEDSYTPGITAEDITTNRFFVGLRYQF